ncbi:DEAD/DEAH box helicase [uncultured Pseudokineococcus sp.]|uniref:Lhr family helicase n=1 Tax=uncultured Pseudokineococcus sp. TaxID=1642928 RepID=UPI002615A243|nr:DEAD/DEAH box helicase [uncultured Pseudokineococcus sp.]
MARTSGATTSAAAGARAGGAGAGARPGADVLDRFSEATRRWFTGAFAAPTAAQAGAWDAISSGDHTLVVAPTGSGKTLSAFLWSIDRLVSEPVPEAAQRCRVLYVSPLKALASDVQRNLRAPLTGIGHERVRLGLPEPDVQVGIRSGDTSAADRRLQARRPPDVLITTPESLFLVLTSKARESLAGVTTVVLDEVHAVAGTKRGAHLALSLERLDAMLPRPAQRIGLSATVRPPEAVARFLAGARPRGEEGGRPVTVVQPPSEKRFDLSVVVPVEDMSRLGEPTDDLTGAAAGAQRTTSIWPSVEERIVDLVAPTAGEQRSTLVFANSRRLAERLTARLNEEWAERLEAEAAGGVVDLDASPGGDGGGHEDDGQPRRLSPGDAPGLFGAGGGQHLDDEVRDDEHRDDDGHGEDDDEGDEDAPQWAASSGTRRAERPRRPPAEVMAQAGASAGAPAVLARAHHGSVSKEQRALIEDDLKSGRLPAVVATSSLELGIDMGAVDLVVQVESPPSVASGLQRVGRAGHQVGAVSRGVLFPKFRSDLVQTAVVTERMREGRIEELRIPSSPLDVLAQQVVAMTAMDDWSVDDLEALVRRAASFEHLSRGVLEAVLDMLSGRYPSEEFAELRPRVVWDRVTGVLSGRPGAQRLAVTSGGTIPDRGLYGVFLASGEGPGRRVGELDEEMVYESRVGDVFTLGASTWRIEDITRDQVLVTPAPGQPGKLPFWHGDALGRPAELGRALGAFVRELAAAPGGWDGDVARGRARAAGLDAWAVDNLLGYLREQQEATGHLPDDRTLVVERFRDELGDWRVVVHSPFGQQLHAPWALAVAARMRERFGVDVQAMPADDGLVLRLPDVGYDGGGLGGGLGGGDDDEGGGAGLPDLADVLLMEPDDVAGVVTDELGGSALFAARFRECAGRALLLPRRSPDRRQPLWQQRQRAAQLLEVASRYPSFPIVLETVRECLQDVFDVPALEQLLRELRSRSVRVVEVTTQQPSPFARSLMFGYVAQFLYEGDSPLAERRAAALSLDPGLLAELLGRGEGASLADLLDPEAVLRTHAELQRLLPERGARGAEDVADLLRVLGPLSALEVARRTRPDAVGAPPQDAAPAGAVVLGADEGAVPGGASDEEETGADDAGAGPAGGAAAREDAAAARVPAVEAWLQQLERSRRVIAVRIAGEERWAAVEDAGRLRDALGTPLPVGVPEAFTAPVPDPVGELVSRHARTHVPFTSGALARRLGLGTAVVDAALRRLEQRGRLVRGDLLPDGVRGRLVEGPADEDGAGEGDHAEHVCDAEVLRVLRRRSLAALRAEVEPVPPEDLASFLPRWQGVGARLRGAEGLVRVVEQLSGAVLPASALESLVLPARLQRYTPALLDELTASGEVLWCGHGSLPGDDGWVSLHLADSAHLTLRPRPAWDAAGDGARSDVVAAAAAGGRDDDALELTDDHRAVLDALDGGGAYFFRALADAVGSVDDDHLAEVLWDLVWDGRLTNDTLSPLRARLRGGRTRHRTAPAAPRSRYAGSRRGWAAGRSRPGRPPVPVRGGPPHAAGRWSLLPLAEEDATVRAAALGEVLLDRYGVVTRGSVAAERVAGGFAGVYRVLAAMEDAGRVRRGYFVEGLGASQFAGPGAVDRLRAVARPLGESAAGAPATGEPGVPADVLSACDPANPFGAALPWPPRAGAPTDGDEDDRGAGSGSEDGGAEDRGKGAGTPEEGRPAGGRGRPARAAGALVVLREGRLLLYVERGGRSVRTWTDDEEDLRAAARALVTAVRDGGLGQLLVQRADGEPVLAATGGVAAALEGAGFTPTPRGLRLRP